MRLYPSAGFARVGCCIFLVVSCLTGVTPKGVTAAASTEATAGSFYIDANNANASDSNPGTEALPWKTISKANQILIAGDTVYVKAGSYTTYIAPANSGSASQPITYRRFGNDIVTVQNASYGIRLNGRSYIHIEGINFFNLDRFVFLENSANHNVISYCHFDQMRNFASWAGSRIWLNSSYNRIHHCRFSKYGGCSGTPPNGTGSGVVLEIGDEESTTDFSNYNLIEDCVMYHGGHHVLGVMGQYNVIRNNSLHNEGWSQGRGNRTLYMNGYAVDTGRNLIESNRFGYSALPCNGSLASGVQITSHRNIFRFNNFYFNESAGLQFSESSNYYQDTVYNHVYNNTFFHNAQTDEPDPGNAAAYFAIWDGPLIIKFNVFKNNLYSGHPKAYGVYRVNLSDQTFANEFNGDTAGDPRFVNATATPGDPMTDDYPDLHLKSNSPCIDRGSFLTTITASSGSGTNFTVADAGYFMDGWGIPGVQGDEIQILGTSQKARITNINYGTNTISVDRSLSWTQNQGVALAYAGAAPDAGAYEYGALREDLVGTWDGQGVFYRNSEAAVWSWLSSPADLIACGDLHGDGCDDLIGVWPGQAGIWTRNSADGDWAFLGNTPRHLSAGDMDGDGRADVLATWDGQGVFYRASTDGQWVQIASPANIVSAGDLDGDGRADLICVLSGQAGIWVKYSQAGDWSYLGSSPRDIASGDMNGDGRADFVGTWDGQGVFYRNSMNGTWIQLATASDQVAVGDLDGDGIDDLVGIWPGQAGVWVKYSQTQSWSFLSFAARDISAGKFGGGAWASGAGSFPRLGGPSGQMAGGPGGIRFDYRKEGELFPRPERSDPARIPGPGEPGFAYARQKNLSPAFDLSPNKIEIR
jgi:hypothetical protein